MANRPPISQLSRGTHITMKGSLSGTWCVLLTEKKGFGPYFLLGACEDEALNGVNFRANASIVNTTSTDMRTLEDYARVDGAWQLMAARRRQREAKRT